MPVQIEENWSDIRGTIIRSEPSLELEDFHIVNIKVEEVQAVEGFPNLLKDSVGQVVPVYIPDNLVHRYQLKNGMVIICRMRRASLRKNFIHTKHLEVRL
jgi:hypothetical protein